MRANPYQVARSTELEREPRKWECVGTIAAPSHRSAAYRAGVPGEIVAEHVVRGHLVFEFPGSTFVRVGFGI